MQTTTKDKIRDLLKKGISITDMKRCYGLTTTEIMSVANEREPKKEKSRVK